MLTFAVASAGMTVLAPSPVKPPRIPWISNVGSAQRRSSTEYFLQTDKGFPLHALLQEVLLGEGSFFQAAALPWTAASPARRSGDVDLPSCPFRRVSSRHSSSWAFGAAPPYSPEWRSVLDVRTVISA